MIQLYLILEELQENVKTFIFKISVPPCEFALVIVEMQWRRCHSQCVEFL